MHELSIALSLLDVAEQEAERHGGGRVRAIHLKLGPLSGVDGQALLSAYELAREGSALEGSHLVIEEVPVVAFCPACAAERGIISVQEVCCSACGTPTPQIVSGRELEIIALELE